LVYFHNCGVLLERDHLAKFIYGLDLLYIMPTVQIAEKNRIEIAKFTISYSDLFVLDALWEYVHNWLHDADWNGRGDYQHSVEHFYAQSDYVDGTFDLIAMWRLQRVPQNNPFIRFHMDVDWKGSRIKPVVFPDPNNQGNRINAHKGSITLNVTAIMELDYQHKAEQWPWKLLYGLVGKQLIKPMTEEFSRELFQEAYAFQTALKVWLKAWNKHLKPTFHPSQAYPSHRKF